MSYLTKFVKDCFTGIDGETGDLWRVMWAGVIAAPMATAYGQVVGSFLNLFRDRPVTLWSPQDWATWALAIAGLLVSGAAALSLKSRTEPQTTRTTTTAAVSPSGGAAGAIIERENG